MDTRRKSDRPPAPSLPSAVRRLAATLGVRHIPQYDQVALLEVGRMRQDAASDWMFYEAEQTISLIDCAFDWEARTGFAGAVRVRDSLDARGGRLAVRALGVVPLKSAPRGPEVTRGELFRYLAELPWAPGAILANRNLRWTVESPHRLRVAAGAGDSAAEVLFSLDKQGRIADVYAADRPRAVDDGYAPTPWRGHFLDYYFNGEVWMPAAGIMSWVLHDVETPVWEGCVIDWRPK